MLWELSVTEQRYRAVLEVRAGVPVTEVAERYGVSRQRVHAWLRRYRDEGPSGLSGSQLQGSAKHPCHFCTRPASIKLCVAAPADGNWFEYDSDFYVGHFSRAR